MEFREDVLSKLRRRNAAQCVCFAPILKQNNELVVRVNALKHHNQALESEVQQLRGSKADRILSGELSVSGGEGGALQQKVQQLQEELTASYKRNSENAHQMLEISQQMQRAQEELNKKVDEYEDLLLLHGKLGEEAKRLQRELEDTKAAIEVLRDELMALRQEYHKSEEKCSKLQAENQELLNRWMRKVTEEADKLNEANRFFQDVQQMKETLRTTESGGKYVDEVTAREGPLAATSAEAFRQLQVMAIPNKPSRNFIGHRAEINSVRYSHGGRFFATGSSDKTVKIWDSRTGENQSILPGSQQSVMCVRFSYNDQFVVGASNDHATRLWSVELGRIKHTLTGHVGKVYTADFSGDSQRVVTGSHDRTLKLWDLGKGYCIRTIFCSSSCNDLALTLDNLAIISGHLDGNLKFWDMKNGDCAHIVSGHHSKPITSVSLSPDGRQVLTASRDNSLKLYDMRSYDTLHTFSADSYRSGVGWAQACFSADGKFVAAPAQDGSVYIWNALTGKQETVLRSAHSSVVFACDWHPEGKQIVSCDKSASIVLWGN